MAYDVVVIGAGPGGYVSAIRAAQLGLSTAIVEKEYWGGMCLNWGCIPAKALLYNAAVYGKVKENASQWGFEVGQLKVNYGAGFQRSRKVVQRLTRGVQGLMKKNKIETFEGTATLLGPNQVGVTLNQGGERELETKNVVLATGSWPRPIPGVEIDGEDVISAWHVSMQVQEVPRRLAVIGAGAVGVEFGHLFHAFGSEVTIIEMMDSVTPLEDQEVSAHLQRTFERRGITVWTQTKVEKVEKGTKGLTVTATSKDGETRTVEADKVLMATGHGPVTKDLGLEQAGVGLDQGGFVRVDDHLRSTASSVWAIGDLVGAPMLAHKGMHEGVIAAENIAGHDRTRPPGRMVPKVTFCEPQIGSVGYTEAEAREAGHEVKVATFPFQAIGRALTTGEADGFVKLVADQTYNEILGAHIIGPEASELVHEMGLALTLEATAAEIEATIHAHPTLFEGVHEAALGLLDGSIHI